MRKLFCLFGLFAISLSASASSEWLYYKHYPWVYDNVSKDWLYLRGSSDGEIYAYRSSTKEWEVFEVSEPTWEQKYEEWILDPEPYGGLDVLQQIKEAKDGGAYYLKLNLNNISDITPVAGLSSLRQLWLDGNDISHLTPLASMTNLFYLNLGDNNISDLTPLEGLTNLLSIVLHNNNISDITPLEGLTDLNQLSLSQNNITDLSPLAGLTRLNGLYINDNNISNLTPLSGLTFLSTLYLEDNNISNVTPLAGLTNLGHLYLSENNISDLTPLAGLTNLTKLGLWDNNISDISPLAGLTNLTWLNLGENNITDLTPLAGLTNLTVLYLEENPISSSQKAMLEEALPNTNIYWPDEIIDDSEPAETSSITHTAQLNNGVSLEMIWVEPGTFTMGSPETEEGRDAVGFETQYEVTLTNGFYLGKHEVTQAQYEAVMTGNSDGLSAKPSYWPNNPNRPVEQVSWDDVQKFLFCLNAQQADNIPAGWAYVLPTEAQWEYACRAGTTTAYSWGDSITTDNTNYLSSGYSQTRDVGLYDANPWGFFDMHGNVWEWTADWHAAYSSGSVADPKGPATGMYRVLRGGSWNNPGSYLRSAARSFSYPNAGNETSYIGFRLAFRQFD